MEVRHGFRGQWREEGVWEEAGEGTWAPGWVLVGEGGGRKMAKRRNLEFAFWMSCTKGS